MGQPGACAHRGGGRRLKILVLIPVILLSGCVGMDMGDDAGGSASDEIGLNSEQRWQLKSAAKDGENELVSTVARMSYSYPEDTSALIDYAIELKPDGADQIRAAARGSRHGGN